MLEAGAANEVEAPPPLSAEPLAAAEAGGEATPAAHAPLSPVLGAERIELIDVVRGVALAGILAANMRGHNAPAALYGHIGVFFEGFADRFAQGLIDVFISGKFITLFACLFGMGFAVQMSRAEARGVRPGSFYPRRLLVLLGFGLIHGALVWWGDILMSYALLGFVLLAFRRQPPERLLRWAAGMLLGILITMTVVFTLQQVFGGGPPEARPERARQELARVVHVYQHGAQVERVRENFAAWSRYLAKTATMLAFLPPFLFGLWLWRRGVIQDPAAHVAMIRRTCAWALPAGLLLNTFATVVQIQRPDTFPAELIDLAAAAARFYGPLVLALGYGAGLILLGQHAAWRRRLAVFAPVGRMALTNYLMQSVVCLLLFTSTGLYGRVGPAWGLVPTVVIYAAQVWFSNMWLARYRFGPMEYLWRTLTYGRLGPMRHQPAVG